MNITASPGVTNYSALHVNNKTAAMDTAQQQTTSGCKACHARLVILKKQTNKIMKNEYRKMIAGNTTPAIDSLLHIVYQNLKLPEQHLNGTSNKICTSCGLHIDYLKRYSLLSLQTASFAPFMIHSNIIPRQSNEQTQQDNRRMENKQNVSSHGQSSDSLNGNKVQGINQTTDRGMDVERSGASRPCASPTAAHFFTEAARKFNIPNKKKTLPRSSSKSKVEDEGLFPTNFARLISQVTNPPGLFKYMGRRVDGKVSVMLRIAPNETTEEIDSFIEVDQRRKQISVLPPKNTNVLPEKLRTVNNAPKLFAFDSIFESEMTQNRVSSASLLDVLHAVINGGEGCLLSYGASSVGKTRTMVGISNSSKNLGVMPSAISWIYSLIEDCKQRTGARISVRVSAVEVVGPNENLKDLLSEQACGGDSTDSSGASPGIYLREDPVGGTVQLGNVSEPQAVSAEKAAFYLDAALAARTTETDKFGEKQSSHVIYTMHIYQYRVDKTYKSRSGGAVPYSGGRSRLHLIDLSHVNQKFDQMQNGVTPSHAGLGQIIVAMLNGFKQLPYRDSKITRLLKDSIGNPTCRTTLIAHVSAQEKNYSKTMSTIQMVSKIHKSRRKRNKYCSSSSDTSCDESRRRGRPHAPLVKTYGIDDSYMSSDCATSSAGEDSCDTVIYMGSSGHSSDRDLSDNERPPSPNTINNIKLKLASSSEDESNEMKLTLSSSDEEKSKVDLAISQELNEKIRKLQDSPKRITVAQGITIETIKPFTEVLPEKAVNIVAPLIIKPDLETKTKLTNEQQNKENLEENLFESMNILKENEESPNEKAPSEKELRKREKRIAKLLKESDDMFSVSNKTHNKLDGYMSDVNKSLRHQHKMSDGYISAPENYRSKPIQVVKGTVRQPIISEDHDTSPKDILSNLLAKLNGKEAAENDFTLNETCLDALYEKEAELICSKDIGTSVDGPRINKNIINVSKENISLQVIETLKKVDVYSDSYLNNISDTCELLQTYKCNSIATEQSSSKSVIHNLDHVITVSAIPNFSVAKRQLNSYLGSPQLNTRADVKTGDELIEFKTPQFERSYSREDTASLVSVNESEAYDSDNYSAYSASPSMPQRTRRPTRLKYRWSTVFEEDENKKENKLDKNNKTLTCTPVSPKPIKKLESKSPKISKRFQIFSSSKSTDSVTTTPKASKKFSLLSPNSERKLLKVPNSDKRISHCSDSSSGIGSNSSNSQSSSLQSGEEIKIDYSQPPLEKETKTRLWPFSRRSRKSRSYSSGYVSDGNITDSSTRLSRRQKLFGSKSKASIYTDGHSSGYDTSITENGMTSCAEDVTDSESVSYSKKKKRFLNFRRRSTNDLSASRGRVKKPIWFDSRRCQSDDEGVQIKVYEIDGPQQANRSRCKSEGAMSPDTRSTRIEELKKHREHLKRTANIPSNNTTSLNTLQIADELEKENYSMGKKLKAIKNHIQVVTCFDGQVRKTTQI